MSAPPIHINSIELDLHGVLPAMAHDALASLGPALELALAAQTAQSGASTHAHVERGIAPPIRLALGADSSALRDALAQSLACAIASHLPQTDSP
jgi:hypothetical protein